LRFLAAVRLSPAAQRAHFDAPGHGPVQALVALTALLALAHALARRAVHALRGLAEVGARATSGWIRQ
jgi:hypothetical protein